MVLPRLCSVCSKDISSKRKDAKVCSQQCQDKLRLSRPRKQYTPEQHRMWREKRYEQEGYREEVAKRANDRATRRRRWLDDYKLKVGCIDCGFRLHPAALHFDHISGEKLFNVSLAKSLGSAKSEIEKCVVRCANCHAIKTWPHLLVRT